ncbi:hypothetical protein LSH36_678g01050 [Paralvinella palmiformis]|uniref:Uncharacterized protein n=1 Tax=Paralvinella palmiformis TaxID=53620 RepID=A0AAD9J3M0_9ANNE|nr:hypothetical protein LSH36_678g01050 [Paralvinella palmiformis]
MPPSKTRGRGGTSTRRFASPKPQLKTIRKTPCVKNMKIPASALSTPLTPGWVNAAPELFSQPDASLDKIPDPFENRRMTRRYVCLNFYI